MMNESSRQNKAAWEYDVYGFWVRQSGTPRERAAKAKADPLGMLGKYAAYFDRYDGVRIANICGSCGKKAIPLALLGADVTIFDISEDNRRYALETAEAAGTQIRYVVGDVLEMDPGTYGGWFDVVFMEGGILHYFHDIHEFMRIMYTILRPGGKMICSDFHPFNKIADSLHLETPTMSYFSTDVYEGEMAHARFYEEPVRNRIPKCRYRKYTVSEIINAILATGFCLERFDEHPAWENEKLPGEFTAVAVRKSEVFQEAGEPGDEGAAIRKPQTDDAGTELTEKFVSGSAEILKKKLTGIYLHGSAAMGCYQPKNSDLDFMVVVEEELTDEEKRKYMDRIVALEADGPAKGIEMSVVLRRVCDPFVYPTPFLLHYSKMHTEWYRKDPDGYIRNMNGTDRDLAAHFTVIRNRGNRLYGLPVDEVFGEVPEEDYLDSIREDVAGAAERMPDNPMYFILNLARVLAYVREKTVLSKKEGGMWGLRNLPEKYHPLIRTALDEYENGTEAQYDTVLARDYADDMLGRISGGQVNPTRGAAGELKRAIPGEGKMIAGLACELWPEHTAEEMSRDFEELLNDHEAAVFLYRKQGEAVGFAQCQLRHDYVEGTESSPVGYLEGVYVKESERQQGVARALLKACEDWAKTRGCTEFASDCELTNTESQGFHQAVGFCEANRIVAYVKKM